MSSASQPPRGVLSGDAGKTDGWHVLGSGALGSLFASFLADSGQDVTFVGRRRARVPPAGTVELTLERAAAGSGDAGSTRRFPLVSLRPADGGGSPRDSDGGRTISRLIVATKAYHLPGCLRPVLPLLRPGCAIFFLQNGVGWDGGVARLLHSDRGRCSGEQQLRIFGGNVAFGAFIKSSSEEANVKRQHVFDAGPGDLFLGPLKFLEQCDGEQQSLPVHDGDADLHTLAAALKGSGQKRVHVIAEEELARRRWAKLAINSVINGLTGFHRCLNGDLLGLNRDRKDDETLEFEAVRETYETLLEEVTTVFEASGLIRNGLHSEGDATAQVVFPSRAALREVVDRTVHDTAKNRSSTLQDVEAGRETELRYMNGQVRKMALLRGVAAPLNSEICVRFAL